MTERTIALIVAAGKSERMGSEIPKPYLQLGDAPLLRQTVKQFLSHPEIDGVRVVIKREHHPHYRQTMKDLTLFPCVIGGEHRQESVRFGLESIAHRKPTRVLVHDAARPAASHELISRVLGALDHAKGAIPALPVTDTIKRGEDGHVTGTIDRQHLYTVQTPQAFDFNALLIAHHRFADEHFTDDSSLMEHSGEKVVLVEGDPENIKITTQKDIEHMRTMMSLAEETRVGSGFDVHAFKTHDPDTPVSQQQIKLCGIKIPYTHYLEGHSDADVGLHALVDALLGAIGDGDIGMHFPPEDPKWQGADSERFLLHAYELVKSRGGDIVHLDVTLICEKPKISHYREQMVQHIAQLLKLTPDRVSVKATTTEKLGFTGRSEGIAAQAVATVRLPRN